jgi:hypothetical protein
MTRREPPERLKRRLSKRYLGIAGIHGIGLMRGGRVLRVYCTPGKSAQRKAVLANLRQDAEQFELEIVDKPPPRVG